MSGTEATAPTGDRSKRALTVTMAVLFGLLFGYDLVEAVTNLVGVPAQFAAANEFARENDLRELPVPWGILVANTLLPILAYAVAWRLGRRRGLAQQAVLFAMALAAVAALTLTFTALV